MTIIFLIINVNFYIDWLNGFLAAYEAFFDFLLSLATVLMVIATAWVAFENKKLREHQLEPIVFIDAQQRKGFHEIIYLIIRNIGLGPAYDVKFDVNNSDLKVNSDKYISEIGILKDGLSYIPPDHEWRLILTSLSDPNFNQIINKVIDIDVTYKNRAGVFKYDKYTINLARFCGFDILNDSERHAKADILASRNYEINQSNDPYYSESDYS